MLGAGQDRSQALADSFELAQSGSLSLTERLAQRPAEAFAVAGCDVLADTFSSNHQVCYPVCSRESIVILCSARRRTCHPARSRRVQVLCLQAASFSCFAQCSICVAGVDPGVTAH